MIAAVATTKTTAKTLPRKRLAKGPERPRYLESRDLDRMMVMFVALMSEVSALRDRLDTHEALADGDKPAKTEAVESYRLSEGRQSKREQRRAEMLKRVFRALTEELEQSRADANSSAAG